jgi:hypothetical protein
LIFISSKARCGVITRLQRIATRPELKTGMLKYHGVIHHLNKPALLELLHVFIPLVISDNGQLRFLGSNKQKAARTKNAGATYN